MRNKVFLLITFILLALTLTACSNKVAEEQTERADFVGDITENAWYADVSALGLSGTLDFNQEDAGTVTLSDGRSHEFEYSISNLSDDGKKADITIDGTGIGEIDGKTVKAEITDRGLKLTYMGFSYTLEPED